MTLDAKLKDVPKKGGIRSFKKVRNKEGNDVMENDEMQTF